MSEMNPYSKTGNRLYLNAEDRRSFWLLRGKRPAREIAPFAKNPALYGLPPFWANRRFTPPGSHLSGGTVDNPTLKKRKDDCWRPRIASDRPCPLIWIPSTLRTASRSPEVEKKIVSVLFCLSHDASMADRENRYGWGGIPDAPHNLAKVCGHWVRGNALQNGVPTQLCLKKWMGHASIKPRQSTADRRTKKSRTSC